MARVEVEILFGSYFVLSVRAVCCVLRAVCCVLCAVCCVSAVCVLCVCVFVCCVRVCCCVLGVCCVCAVLCVVCCVLCVVCCVLCVCCVCCASSLFFFVARSSVCRALLSLFVFRFLFVALLYESPGGNQVDGLPPALN